MDFNRPVDRSICDTWWQVRGRLLRDRLVLAGPKAFCHDFHLGIFGRLYVDMDEGRSLWNLAAEIWRQMPPEFYLGFVETSATSRSLEEVSNLAEARNAERPLRQLDIDWRPASEFPMMRRVSLADYLASLGMSLGSLGNDPEPEAPRGRMQAIKGS